MNKPLERGAFQSTRKTRQKIIDCDIHPRLRSHKDLHPYLSQQWKTHLDNFGMRYRQPWVDAPRYPKATPAFSMRDAWPPDGGVPGSSLSFMQEQYLDPCGVEYGILFLLHPWGMKDTNMDFGTALCSAANDWQHNEWTRKDRRLKGSLLVNGEDPQGSVAELERWAGNSDFVQLSLSSGVTEPLGRRRYWPIYEAAVRLGLPLGFHNSGDAAGGAGWPSFYQEFQHWTTFELRELLTSFVFEGVFERFPTLKVVLVEGGFAWINAWCWRADRQWIRMRDEVPHLKMLPSEYVKRAVYLTTQPMDEPERVNDIHDVISWFGEDRFLFASDYPHWDWDDPSQAFKCALSEAERHRIYFANAAKVYGLEPRDG
ncbi:putative TIM-barrel fold metal-dependent hydrolase [Bradyrhizobium sp. USDA 4524]|uniref:amidohydrolase family protein n=1 Tax=unclassified Bradyrhizobium TaxID=2631580 RepID=UPI0020A1A0FE|nr:MULTISPECIES: amidohydrolase family protein [unclassified Bradyrhizobium]MCP1838530.1 putative TIM-barrel fold metal-dependent hydrolase [Bradyrhizobium sp. USDA 4538]MCP1899095.1 putative TIM-barrel fold metal-dependent hydrolase [Bradyrhizobium sp. USDA 4537]MCP1986792.1 putative TIM-barrel fold metal-dependent hydrolase [Bradyrhizobium sp. USDA 4539]